MEDSFSSLATSVETGDACTQINEGIWIRTKKFERGYECEVWPQNRRSSSSDLAASLAISVEIYLGMLLTTCLTQIKSGTPR